MGNRKIYGENEVGKQQMMPIGKKIHGEMPKLGETIAKCEGISYCGEDGGMGKQTKMMISTFGS